MTTKMLIDAAHPEETRVVVTRGNRVEEFDFESANRRPLRGNIYLAKVTRVEPSLQAAFVDFGGNRHGFLAFSEIHPDYYQIPTADRLALLAEEAEAARDEDGDEEEGRRPRRSRAKPKQRGRGKDQVAGPVEGDAEDAAANGEIAADGAEAEAEAEVDGESAGAPSDDTPKDEEHVEQLGGGGDAMEEVPMRAAHRTRRQYKIQEVIKRRQILLVQVVKEERGTKGAALTTYLSLAGRYSVLMPNTARGGGISRKITSATDRKRLKSMASELEVPAGMGVILRTAGASRTKVEIKRDFEYLMRLWESVRSLTLESTAPALVYEEGSLIKRAIRDLYSKDIEEILVAGEEGYREAKDFMRMLMPSHAKAVQPYRDATPLFSRTGVESQLDAMFSNVVTLKSGGYIVMNQTEALVSIDVNSGRSTREHNIEDTALKTNLEAAEEVARQLRLRDLAGLVVIDFIDMEEKRNNKAVERKLNDCLKNDRARIQVGRISHFGLLEMSRQRIRTGVLESSTIPCPHCAGTGLLRSTPSLALHVLRAMEDTLLRGATHDITLKTRLETAFYILNQKRESLRALEARFGVTITVVAESALPPGQHFQIERGEPVQPRMVAERVEGEAVEHRPAAPRHQDGPRVIHPEDIEMDDIEVNESEEAEADGEAEAGRDGEKAEGERKRRRRRRRRGGRDRERGDGQPNGGEIAEASGNVDGDADAEGDDEDDENGEESRADGAEGGERSEGERKRRRRRRGGRRNRRDRDDRPGEGNGEEGNGEEGAAGEAVASGEPMMAAAEPTVEVPVEQAPAEVEPAKKPRRSRAKKTDEAETVTAEAPAAEASAPEAPAEKPAKAPRSRARKATAASEAPVAVTPPAEEPVPVPPPAPVVAAPAPAPQPEPEPEPEDPNRPKRSGWWSRAKQALGG
ncbi:ribonuclease E/G [Rhabdaerophilum sp. SD176]|uniref:Rne/Rng family ribonuclease n=1 Tax=Rhabdaerophilum sp. SD176 TaxID=2983548 RepID=UPI0024DFCDAD|nr:ribonuclease E/G [Rhabdaerophilum sp. SD176]